MRFLRKNKKSKKVILVISDLHLGAGVEVDGRVNPLEDFHSDKELVDFIEYYCAGEYLSKDVELVINGDFVDLLAVPFVPQFDDEYWSETASLNKLDMILKAHPEVMDALAKFLSTKNKNIVYIIGNHDAELLFASLKERFTECFPADVRSNIVISNDLTLYEPTPGVFIQHGHEYEDLHHFDEKTSIVESSKGEKYFIPPWGSYYVTHVINKYKLERDHLNCVRPIKNFLVHGLIFDTFFILRFMIANAYFYFMIRFLRYYRLKLGWGNVFKDVIDELTLFQDYETLTRAFFESKEEAKVLIVGHTHEPIYRQYSDGTRFINTGTWTRMVNLDLSLDMNDTPLTYAKIEIFDTKYTPENFSESVNIRLNKWVPKSLLPYEEFR
jgi:UDP-2,3-diacylglucosamine pyrophosphatase LpxH